MTTNPFSNYIARLKKLSDRTKDDLIHRDEFERSIPNYKMKRVQKEYTHAFLVEPTKLTRLIDLIHERLGENPETTVRDHFEAFLPDKRVEEVSNLEDVLSLENSRKKRIERLLIVSSGGGPGDSPEHLVEVDFGVVKIPINSPPSAQAAKLIAVNIVSNDSKWNARTLSEIEEQIEKNSTATIFSYLGSRWTHDLHACCPLDPSWSNQTT